MSARAALVTGASSGIGLSLARLLAQDGYGVTIASRRQERLAAADVPGEVQRVVANVADEDAVATLVATHAARFGRLDVLVNSAGVAFGAPVEQISTTRLDLELATNVRSLVLMYRACAPLLRAAGGAWVVNLASVSGKRGEPIASVYSATKHAVVGFTQSMNRELATDRVRSCALCPAFVDTPMSDFIKDAVPAESMIQTADLDAALRMLLSLSPGCVVPEIVFEPPGGETGYAPPTAGKRSSTD